MNQTSLWRVKTCDRSCTIQVTLLMVSFDCGCFTENVSGTPPSKFFLSCWGEWGDSIFTSERHNRYFEVFPMGYIFWPCQCESNVTKSGYWIYKTAITFYGHDIHVDVIRSYSTFMIKMALPIWHQNVFTQRCVFVFARITMTITHNDIKYFRYHNIMHWPQMTLIFLPRLESSLLIPQIRTTTGNPVKALFMLRLYYRMAD